MILHVCVSDKIAVYQKRDGDIVCGNSDYKIKFTFDSEWDEHTTKTARFVWNGDYTDVDFTGDTCDVPIIHGTDEVKVGVYAGDLSTTTPASIGCKRSILCESASKSAGNNREYVNEAKEAADRAEAVAASLSNVLCAVTTATEMDAILAGATDAIVGYTYIYLGPTTDKYENGSIYRIEKG